MVLLILVAFFGTIASVNAVMIHYALSSFRGEVADHPYEVGLAFNSEIAAARAQEARNWSVAARLVRSGGVGQVEISISDAQGRPIEGLHVASIFAAPVDAALDRRLELEERGPGLYTGEIALARGHWDLELAATRDGATLFQSKNRIFIE
jgi:nitrogen fixation protein FixH